MIKVIHTRVPTIDDIYKLIKFLGYKKYKLSESKINLLIKEFKYSKKYIEKIYLYIS